jgi:glycopeptide antibiotics resistance protein
MYIGQNKLIIPVKEKFEVLFQKNLNNVIPVIPFLFKVHIIFLTYVIHALAIEVSCLISLLFR